MSFDIATGIGGFIVLLALIVIGVPVFFSMLFVTIIGFWLLGGLPLMLSQFTYGLHFMAENYMFAVLPLFILVGEIATQTAISQNAFTAINRWVGKVRGAQLMTVVIANAVIGAISSSPSTGTVLSVRVAMPELEKIKYDKPYCLSAIIASGTLVSLIPPSASILTFCILTGASVGRSLVASIIPGILLTLVFCISIWIYGKIKPEKIPIQSDIGLEVSWREKFLSLISLLPIAVLFLLLVGGIYLGIFTPTAGGAVAATAILIYALSTKVPFDNIVEAFKNTVIMNSQIFPLIIAGFMFARFTTLTGMTDFLLDFVVGLKAPPLVVIGVVIIVYILISFPMEMLPAMIITLPVFFPLLTGIGFSPYTLVVILTILITLAAFTPPTGLAVYTVASLARVNVMDIWRGVTPWFITIFIFVWILILFPFLTTWLPNLFYG